jgi:hypothetical protein
MRPPMTGTNLYCERLETSTERAIFVELITENDGTERGLVEYVRTARRGGGSTYGWRPLHSGWNRSQLKSKQDAACALPPRSTLTTGARRLPPSLNGRQ